MITVIFKCISKIKIRYLSLAIARLFLILSLVKLLSIAFYFARQAVVGGNTCVFWLRACYVCIVLGGRIPPSVVIAKGYGAKESIGKSYNSEKWRKSKDTRG